MKYSPLDSLISQFFFPKKKKKKGLITEFRKKKKFLSAHQLYVSTSKLTQNKKISQCRDSGT